MDTTAPVLTILAVLPLVGSLLGFMLPSRTSKQLTFGFALATLAMGIYIFFAAALGDLTERYIWIPQIGAYYALSLDGMGRAMVLLTVILVPLVMLAEWRTIEDSSWRWASNIFGALVLMLESFALLVFMSADVLLFYIFFEATLIPMFFLIVGWGGKGRGPAAIKFLLFSLAGGLVMLFAVIGVWVATNDAGHATFLIEDAAILGMNGPLADLLFFGFFFAFAVKAPMVPVHSWLPDTAEQATPGATTLLVGILDKIGTFGMIRLCLALFPDASHRFAPVILVLAVVSIFYGAFLAITSTNLLRLVAYTSVSHFGFMVLGIFAFTTASISGSVFYMLAHGFSSAAMFLAVGFLVNRRGSAEIADFGGVQQLAPVLAGTFLVAGLATLGLPGTANFVGEFTIMAGGFQTQPVAVFIAVLGTVLAGVYVLWAYQRVFTGQPADEVRQKAGGDLDLREKLVIGPLIALLLLFGFVPKPMLQVVSDTATQTMSYLGAEDPATPKGGK